MRSAGSKSIHTSSAMRVSRLPRWPCRSKTQSRAQQSAASPYLLDHCAERVVEALFTGDFKRVPALPTRAVLRICGIVLDDAFLPVMVPRHIAACKVSPDKCTNARQCSPRYYVLQGKQNCPFRYAFVERSLNSLVTKRINSSRVLCVETLLHLQAN